MKAASPGPAPRRPGAGEQLAGHAVELAHVSPAKAAQKRAQGGRGLDGAAEHTGRSAGAQGVAVVDAVTAGECGGDQGEQHVAGVRPPRRSAEVEVVVDQLLQAEPAGQCGREEESRVVHQATVVEGCVYAVGGRSLVASNGCSLWLVGESSQSIVPATAEHPTVAAPARFFGGSGLS